MCCGVGVGEQLRGGRQVLLASHEGIRRSPSWGSIARLGEEEGDALQVSERSYGLAVSWLLVLAKRCRNRAFVRHANTCTKWSSLSLADYDDVGSRVERRRVSSGCRVSCAPI